MDQNKNQGQGQQNPNQQQGSQQGNQQNWNQQKNPNREPLDGSRQQQMPGRDQGDPGTQRTQERGTGSQGEKNMDRDLEDQDDLLDSDDYSDR